METDYAEIVANLERLRNAAMHKAVFGSDAHGFMTYPPLTDANIRRFEVEHSVELPADYRGFLQHVGNGGAGPAYGLFRLGEMDDGFGHKSWAEHDGFVGDLSEPFPHSGPWNDLSEEPPLDESREDDEEWEDEYWARVNEWEERVYWNPKQVNGAIPLCHIGCALRQWLVVTGAEAGNMWDDDRADRGGLKPIQQAGQSRITFLAWYKRWLDEALKQLPS